MPQNVAQTPPWELYQKQDARPPWELYGPPKTRQLPVMTAQGPAGMRPATEEEFAEHEARMAEGGAIAGGLAATAPLGLLAGAPGAVGLAARALPAATGLYAAVKTGSVAGGIAAATYALPAVLRPFGKYLERIAKGRAAAAEARAAVEATKSLAKRSSSTAPPMGGTATASTRVGPAEVVPFPSKPTVAVPVKAPVAPAPAAPKLPEGEFFKSPEEVQAAIVRMAKENKLSRNQIVSVLKERGIRERGAATTMTDLVLKALKEGRIQ